MTEPSWPVRIEILAGKLVARVYLHEIDSQHGAIACWSYVSEGLTAQQQAEVVFTLRRYPDEPVDAFPREPLQLLGAIHQVTETGQRVTSGSFTECGPDAFFGHHILYVRAQALAGVKLPASCLAALLVTGDELRAVREFGSTRVLARLGQATTHYPFPPWADRRRPGLSLERTFETSLLSKLPRASAHDVHVSLQGSQLTVTALRSEQASWQARLAEVPEAAPLALLTAFDPAANGCLTWVPGQKEPEAIIPPGSDGSRVCGCFVAFGPEQAANTGKILEDGFVMELTTEAWLAIRRALIDGKELSLPASSDEISFALTWSDEVYVSPIDVRAYNAVDATASKVKIGQVRVVTPEAEFTARTSVPDLAAFCQRIERCAERMLAGHAAALLVEVRCTLQGHDLHLSGDGDVPPDRMQAFVEALRVMDRLPIRDGEVSFEVELSVSH